MLCSNCLTLIDKYYQVDRDGNGTISLTEYFGIFEEHGVTISQAECKRLSKNCLPQSLPSPNANYGLLIWKTISFFQKWKMISFFQKWRTVSIFSKMEDDLNFIINGRQPFFSKLEDDLKCLGKWKRIYNILANGSQPHFGKSKTMSIFGKMEDDLNLLENRRQSQYFEKWKMIYIFCQMEINAILRQLKTPKSHDFLRFGSDR
jgi:hypothetical protein